RSCAGAPPRAAFAPVGFLAGGLLRGEAPRPDTLIRFGRLDQGTSVLREVVGEAARRFTDTPAYVAAERWSVTYADLDRVSDEVAAGLVARGVGPGDVVALALPACPEYFVAYLASAKAGAVTAGVNPRLSAPER